jgi:hypothetical protein
VKIRDAHIGPTGGHGVAFKLEESGWFSHFLNPYQSVKAIFNRKGAKGVTEGSGAIGHKKAQKRQKEERFFCSFELFCG